MEQIEIDGRIRHIEYKETRINDIVYDKNSGHDYMATLTDADDLNWIVKPLDLPYKDQPSNDKVRLLRNMWENETGAYIGYYQSLEGSGLGFGDELDVVKDQWCFGCAVFKNNGLGKTKLRQLYPTPPERGVILEYLRQNYELIHNNGVMITDTFKSKDNGNTDSRQST